MKFEVSSQNGLCFHDFYLLFFFFFFYCYLSLQVINDLLDPTGQNLRIREDAQVLIIE